MFDGIVKGIKAYYSWLKGIPKHIQPFVNE